MNGVRSTIALTHRRPRLGGRSFPLSRSETIVRVTDRSAESVVAWRQGVFSAVLRLSGGDRRRALEAGLELTRASLELWLLPPARGVGVLGSLSTGEPAGPVADGRRHEAERVGRVVASVAGRLPWRPTCLRQALAAQRMLRRRGIPARLHLGVAGATAGSAHAWVTVDDEPVLGSRGIERFVALAAFEQAGRSGHD